MTVSANGGSPSHSEDRHPEWIYCTGDSLRCSHRLGGGYTKPLGGGSPAHSQLGSKLPRDAGPPRLVLIDEIRWQ